MKRFLPDYLRPGCFAFINKHFVFVIRLPHRLVGLVGRILLVEKLLLVAVEQLLLEVVEQLLFVVVDQLLYPILLSNRDVKRSLAEVEVTCMLCLIRLLQFSI